MAQGEGAANGTVETARRRRPSHRGLIALDVARAKERLLKIAAVLARGRKSPATTPMAMASICSSGPGEPNRGYSAIAFPHRISREEADYDTWG